MAKPLKRIEELEESDIPLLLYKCADHDFWWLNSNTPVFNVALGSDGRMRTAHGRGVFVRVRNVNSCKDIERPPLRQELTDEQLKTVPTPVDITEWLNREQPMTRQPDAPISEALDPEQRKVWPSQRDLNKPSIPAVNIPMTTEEIAAAHGRVTMERLRRK